MMIDWWSMMNHFGGSLNGTFPDSVSPEFSWILIPFSKIWIDFKIDSRSNLTKNCRRKCKEQMQIPRSIPASSILFRMARPHGRNVHQRFILAWFLGSMMWKRMGWAIISDSQCNVLLRERYWTTCGTERQANLFIFFSRWRISASTFLLCMARLQLVQCWVTRALLNNEWYRAAGRFFEWTSFPSKTYPRLIPVMMIDDDDRWC